VYDFLANAIVGFHFLFILFVVFGGWLVIRYPKMAFVHLPAALWGALVEFSGWICPLTPLENHLRNLAGETSYSGDFIQRYLIPVMYPENLTPKIQLVLGSIVVVVNVIVYIVAIRKYRQRVKT
jgi:hypothetical protein